MGPLAAMANKERGSALIEALPVLGVLLTFTAVLLVASYFLFAQAWIQFQSEQTLYCMAEAQSGARCQQQLESKLRAFLPWGEIISQVHGSDQDWSMEVKWQYQNLTLQSHKWLSPNLVLKAKVSPW
jgi:hypothetical protein